MLFEELARKSEYYIVTSLITYVEYYKLQADPKREDIDLIRSYLDQSYYRRIPLDFLIAFKAQDICNSNNVSFADSIHVATAIINKCKYLITTDGKSKKNKTPLLDLDNQIKLDNDENLRILTPDGYWIDFEKKRYEEDLKNEQKKIEKVERVDKEKGQDTLFDVINET